jgi:hypothetical protein
MHGLTQWTVLGMLSFLIVRQEMIRMATKATLTDVTDGLTTLEGDVATLQTTTSKLETDSAAVIQELQTLQANSSNPVDFDSVVARQAAIHSTLQALNASLTTIDQGDVAGETPVTVVNDPPAGS